MKRKIKKFYRKNRMWPTYILAAALTAALVVIMAYPYIVKAQLLNPEGPKSNKEIYVAWLPIPENEDMWVREYADKYGKTLSQKNHIRELLHCLLYNESGYGHNKGHGDSGLAGGPAQFHEATWQRMRKQMLKKGLITEIGSRYDMEQAIQTTAWTIVNGYAKEWEPVLRGYCQ